MYRAKVSYDLPSSPTMATILLYEMPMERMGPEASKDRQMNVYRSCKGCGRGLSEERRRRNARWCTNWCRMQSKLKTKAKPCMKCGELIPKTRRAATKWCSDKCSNSAREEEIDKHFGITRIRGLSSGSVGAVGEMRVAIDLLVKGYEVFRSISPNSSCDLIVCKNGDVYRIEVRTGRPNLNGELVCTRKGLLEGDVLATIDHSGRIIYKPAL